MSFVVRYNKCTKITRTAILPQFKKGALEPLFINHYSGSS